MNSTRLHEHHERSNWLSWIRLMANEILFMEPIAGQDYLLSPESPFSTIANVSNFVTYIFRYFISTTLIYCPSPLRATTNLSYCELVYAHVHVHVHVHVSREILDTDL